MKKHISFLIFIMPFIFIVPAKCQSVNDNYEIKTLQKENDSNKQKIESLDSALTALRVELIRSKQTGFEKFISTSIFIDAAISTHNNLKTVVYKESYRNKIASLNNPSGNEMGFNLELEIRNAIKPLLAKAKNVNENKFTDVLSSFVNKSGKTNNTLFPAGNVFTSVISMVGNMVVNEKKITKNDLDTFINSIEKYFTQYEKLYRANISFSNEIEKFKLKLKYIEDDIKSLLMDVVVAGNKNIQLSILKTKATEDLMLDYFDLKILRQKIDSAPSGFKWEYPADGIKICKEIFISLKRLYEEYQTIYSNNYKEIKNIVSDAKLVSEKTDQSQLNKTLKEIENLYTESKEVDGNNLRFKSLTDKLEQLAKIQ